MNAHNSDAPSPIHAHGVPSDAFSCAGVIALAWPVAVSPIHNSMPFSRVFVNARRRPSGENPIQLIAGVAGSVTFRSAPSATTLRLRLR